MRDQRENHGTTMEADPVSLMLSLTCANVSWKAGSLYSNLFPYTIPDIMFEAAKETTLALLKGSPEVTNKQTERVLQFGGVETARCNRTITLVFLKFLNQAAAFLNYLGFADPFAHPKVLEGGQGETSHLPPGVPVAEQNAWEEDHCLVNVNKHLNQQARRPSRRTVAFIEVMEQRTDVSFPKLLCVVNQGHFNGLVTSQHHHLLGAEVHREHWSILFGQLW